MVLPIVERWADAWRIGDRSAIEAAYSADTVVHGPGGHHTYHPVAQVEQLIGFLRRVLPDFWVRVDEEIVSGDRIAVRWTAGGTQRGAWDPAVPPTNRAVSWSGMSFLRIAGEKVAEEWVEEDLLHLQREVGVVVGRSPG